VADELAKQGFQVDRKRIDLAGVSIKNVGKYKAVIRLYENSSAEIQIVVIGQEIKTETHAAPARPARRRRDDAHGESAASGEAAVSGETAVPAETASSAENGPAEEQAVPSESEIPVEH
jgi:large subunit ribosomal protein L9